MTFERTRCPRKGCTGFTVGHARGLDGYSHFTCSRAPKCKWTTLIESKPHKYENKIPDHSAVIAHEKAIREIPIPSGWSQVGPMRDGMAIARTIKGKRVVRVIGLDCEVISEETLPPFKPAKRTIKQVTERLLREALAEKDKDFLARVRDSKTPWGATARKLAAGMGISLPKKSLPKKKHEPKKSKPKSKRKV